MSTGVQRTASEDKSGTSGASALLQPERVGHESGPRLRCRKYWKRCARTSSNNIPVYSVPCFCWTRTETLCVTAPLPACQKNTHKQSTEPRLVRVPGRAGLPFIESRPSWSRTSPATRSGQAFDTWRYPTVYAHAGQPRSLRRTAGYSNFLHLVSGASHSRCRASATHHARHSSRGHRDRTRPCESRASRGGSPVSHSGRAFARYHLYCGARR